MLTKRAKSDVLRDCMHIDSAKALLGRKIKSIIFIHNDEFSMKKNFPKNESHTFLIFCLVQ